MLATATVAHTFFITLSLPPPCCRHDGIWAVSTTHGNDLPNSQFGDDAGDNDDEIDPLVFNFAFFKTKTLETIFKLWARDNMPDSFTMTADKFSSKLAKFARGSARGCPLPASYLLHPPLSFYVYFILLNGLRPHAADPCVCSSLPLVAGYFVESQISYSQSQSHL